MSAKIYVTVSASGQFAQSVWLDRVWLDRVRKEAVDYAKNYAREQGWDYDAEDEYPESQATPGSALIYHVQEEADRCEDYISVFEVVIEAPPEFHIHTPKNMFDLGFESTPAQLSPEDTTMEDTIGVDADTLTVERIDAELRIHRETLASGRAEATGNIHVRIGDLERAREKKVKKEC